MTTATPTPTRPAVTRFGGLALVMPPDVVAPEPWTEAQCWWAARLVSPRHPGPVLELGGGAVGLETARLLNRELVVVDPDPAVCAGVFADARRNGLAARVIHGQAGSALGASVSAVVVLAGEDRVDQALDAAGTSPVLARTTGLEGVRALADAGAPLVSWRLYRRDRALALLQRPERRERRGHARRARR